MTPREVLQGAAPVPGQPVYAFGTDGRAVTVRSQQRRAIHLVDALLAEGVVSAGSRIAIVGAGAAGLTAAVRAAHAGCRVVVLEREPETLATLRGNTTRLLHPNLYAWPRPGWSTADAQLPVLSWTADNAASVVSTLDRAFRREVARTGLIECRTSVALAWRWPLEVRGPLVVVRWREADGTPHDAAVAAVILAVGFGREPLTAPGSPFPGYWDNDLLGRVHGARTCLILGAGDGGMTDALRVRIRDFDQGSTFEALLGEPDAAGLADEIARIEALPEPQMDAAYRALSTAWLDTAIRNHGLRPTQVTIADSRLAFGPGRFPLNKLLVSRLVRMNELTVVQRRIAVPQATADGGHAPVELEPGAPRTFDLVLVRFGQGNAIGAFGADVEAGCKRMVDHTADPAAEPPAARPPRGEALAPLAHALSASPRVDAAVETVLLYLRHAAAAAAELAADPQFDPLRDEIAGLLHPHASAPIAHASSALAIVQRWLATAAHAPAGVVARALAEAVDFVFGDRLRDAMRVAARPHQVVHVPPNRLVPRGVAADDRRGRRDQGLEALTLNGCEDCDVVVEWVTRSWHDRPRIAVGHVCSGFHSYTVTRVAGQPPRFFGASAAHARDHARALERIAARCDRAAHDFVVLGEFALHADPAWAHATHVAADAHVIAGIGHVQDGVEQQHQWIAVLDRARPRVSAKFAAAVYEREAQRWTEDIHPGPRQLTLAVSGDDRHVALIGGQDLCRLDPAPLLALRPDVVLVVAGAAADTTRELAAALRAAQVAHVVVAIGRADTISYGAQVTELA